MRYAIANTSYDNVPFLYRFIDLVLGEIIRTFTKLLDTQDVEVNLCIGLCPPVSLFVLENVLYFSNQACSSYVAIATDGVVKLSCVSFL